MHLFRYNIYIYIYIRFQRVSNISLGTDHGFSVRCCLNVAVRGLKGFETVG